MGEPYASKVSTPRRPTPGAYGGGRARCPSFERRCAHISCSNSASLCGYGSRYAPRPCARKPSSFGCGKIAFAVHAALLLLTSYISKDVAESAVRSTHPSSTVAWGATLGKLLCIIDN